MQVSECHAGSVCCIHVMADGDGCISTCGDDGSVRLWTLQLQAFYSLQKDGFASEWRLEGPVSYMVLSGLKAAQVGLDLQRARIVCATEYELHEFSIDPETLRKNECEWSVAQPFSVVWAWWVRSKKCFCLLPQCKQAYDAWIAISKHCETLHPVFSPLGFYRLVCVTGRILSRSIMLAWLLQSLVCWLDHSARLAALQQTRTQTQAKVSLLHVISYQNRARLNLCWMGAWWLLHLCVYIYIYTYICFKQSYQNQLFQWTKVLETLFVFHTAQVYKQMVYWKQVFVLTFVVYCADKRLGEHIAQWT